MSDIDNVLCFARHIVNRDGVDLEDVDSAYKIQAALASISRAEDELRTLRQTKAVIEKVKKIMTHPYEEWAGSGWLGERFCIYCGSSNTAGHSANCEYKEALGALP